jgi:hypothetical protein
MNHPPHNGATSDPRTVLVPTYGSATPHLGVSGTGASDSEDQLSRSLVGEWVRLRLEV